VLFDSKAQPELARKSIAEIAAARGVDAFDTMYDILLAESDGMHELMVIAFAYRAEDIRQAYEHPLCMVGSDATALATDGVLAGTSFHGAFTWAAWFVHHFTQETNLMTLPQAIQRITSLPASRVGLNDRGLIRKGAWADLAIFDAAEFRERGTTFEPNQIALGMKHVFVNGVAAVQNGKQTTERQGQVLRK
jgi:N-acyl-D-amino-acid deacylase